MGVGGIWALPSTVQSNTGAIKFFGCAVHADSEVSLSDSSTRAMLWRDNFINPLA
jgi:hypothetical protein